MEENTGIQIEIDPIDRTKDAYSLLDDGTIDYMMGCRDVLLQNSQSNGYVASDFVMDYTTLGITKLYYQFFCDSSPVFALTTARKYLEEYILEQYPNAQIKYYNTAKEYLVAVTNEETNY